MNAKLEGYVSVVLAPISCQRYVPSRLRAKAQNNMQAQRNRRRPRTSHSIPLPSPRRASQRHACRMDGTGRGQRHRNTIKQPDIICVANSSLSARCEPHGSRDSFSLCCLPSALSQSYYRKAAYEHDLTQAQGKIRVFVEMKGHQGCTCRRIEQASRGAQGRRGGWLSLERGAGNAGLG